MNKSKQSDLNRNDDNTPTCEPLTKSQRKRLRQKQKRSMGLAGSKTTGESDCESSISEHVEGRTNYEKNEQVTTYTKVETKVEKTNKKEKLDEVKLESSKLPGSKQRSVLDSTGVNDLLSNIDESNTDTNTTNNAQSERVSNAKKQPSTSQNLAEPSTSGTTPQERIIKINVEGSNESFKTNETSHPEASKSEIRKKILDDLKFFDELLANKFSTFKNGSHIEELSTEPIDDEEDEKFIRYKVDSPPPLTKRTLSKKSSSASSSTTSIKKSRSLDDEDGVQITEILSSDETTVECSDMNVALMSDTEDENWEIASELRIPENSTLRFNAVGLFLDSDNTELSSKEITPRRPQNTQNSSSSEEENNLREYLQECININNEFRGDSKKMLSAENILERRAKKRALLESYFVPTFQNPRYLDIIQEEGSSATSSTLDLRAPISASNSAHDIPYMDDLDDDVFLENDDVRNKKAQAKYLERCPKLQLVETSLSDQKVDEFSSSNWSRECIKSPEIEVVFIEDDNESEDSFDEDISNRSEIPCEADDEYSREELVAEENVMEFSLDCDLPLDAKSNEVMNNRKGFIDETPKISVTFCSDDLSSEINKGESSKKLQDILVENTILETSIENNCQKDSTEQKSIESTSKIIDESLSETELQSEVTPSVRMENSDRETIEILSSKLQDSTTTEEIQFENYNCKKDSNFKESESHKMENRSEEKVVEKNHKIETVEEVRVKEDTSPKATEKTIKDNIKENYSKSQENIVERSQTIQTIEEVKVIENSNNATKKIFNLIEMVEPTTKSKKSTTAQNAAKKQDTNFDENNTTINIKIYMPPVEPSPSKATNKTINNETVNITQDNKSSTKTETDTSIIDNCVKNLGNPRNQKSQQSKEHIIQVSVEESCKKSKTNGKNKGNGKSKANNGKEHIVKIDVEGESKKDQPKSKTHNFPDVVPEQTDVKPKLSKNQRRKNRQMQETSVERTSSSSTHEEIIIIDNCVKNLGNAPQKQKSELKTTNKEPTEHLVPIKIENRQKESSKSNPETGCKESSSNVTTNNQNLSKKDSKSTEQMVSIKLNESKSRSTSESNQEVTKGSIEHVIPIQVEKNENRNKIKSSSTENKISHEISESLEHIIPITMEESECRKEIKKESTSYLTPICTADIKGKTSKISSRETECTTPTSTFAENKEEFFSKKASDVKERVVPVTLTESTFQSSSETAEETLVPTTVSSSISHKKSEVKSGTQEQVVPIKIQSSEVSKTLLEETFNKTSKETIVPISFSLCNNEAKCRKSDVQQEIKERIVPINIENSSTSTSEKINSFPKKTSTPSHTSITSDNSDFKSSLPEENTKNFNKVNPGEAKNFRETEDLSTKSSNLYESTKVIEESSSSETKIIKTQHETLSQNSVSDFCEQLSSSNLQSKNRNRPSKSNDVSTKNDKSSQQKSNEHIIQVTIEDHENESQPKIIPIKVQPKNTIKNDAQTHEFYKPETTNNTRQSQENQTESSSQSKFSTKTITENRKLEGETKHSKFLYSTDPVRTFEDLRKLKMERSNSSDLFIKKLLKLIAETKNDSKNLQKVYEYLKDSPIQHLPQEMQETIQELLISISKLIPDDSKTEKPLDASFSKEFDQLFKSLSDLNGYQSRPSSSNSFGSSSTPTTVKHIPSSSSLTDILSIINQSDVKSLKDISLDVIKKLPYGAAVLEELAKVSETINESLTTNHYHRSLSDPTNSNKDTSVADMSKLSWMGLPTQDPKLLVCLSPAQQNINKLNADQLLDMHQKFCDRRSYNDLGDQRFNQKSRLLKFICEETQPTESKSYCGEDTKDNYDEFLNYYSDSDEVQYYFNQTPPEVPKRLYRRKVKSEIVEEKIFPDGTHKQPLYIPKLESYHFTPKAPMERPIKIEDHIDQQRLKAQQLSEWLHLARKQTRPNHDHRRRSLPQELHEKQLKYILEKERQIEREIAELENEKKRLSGETKRDIPASCMMYSDFFRKQMYDEYLNKIAERENRKQNKIIKISESSELSRDSEVKPKHFSEMVNIEHEFMSKVKEKKVKLGEPLSQSEDESTTKTSIPKHLQEFVEAINQKETVTETKVVETQEVKIVRNELHERRLKARRHNEAYTKLGRHRISSGLLHEIDSSLVLARGFLLGRGIWSPGQRQKTTSESSETKLKTSTSGPLPAPPPTTASLTETDNTSSVVWTPKSAGTSPIIERKEFKPIKFESPTFERKNKPKPEELKGRTPEPVPTPWQQEQTAVTSLSSTLERRLTSSQSAPISGFNSIHNTGQQSITTARLPKAQNPTITLLQKAREGQLPRGASYIEDTRKTPPRTFGDDRPPIINPNEILYVVKNEYNSETETNGPKKMVDLGPRKFEGIGPTTKDGMPIVLRSEVKENNQAKWYKRMYDTLHKTKDDEYVTIRYKQRKGRYPYNSSGSGYLSEPEANAGSYVYDSDTTTTNNVSSYATLDRRRPQPSSRGKENNYTSSTMPRNSRSSVTVKYGADPYKNQPGRIENYVPGHSSISEKEAKEWWDEVMDIFDGHLEQQKLVPHQSKSYMAQALKESGYESDSTLVFKRRDDSLSQQSQLSPQEQKEAYKSIQKGGEVPLHGLRKLAPERPKEPENLTAPIPPPKGHHHFSFGQESPRRYVENEVTIHYRSPVRHEIKEVIAEEELARRQAEAMRRIYQEERRRKYLQELQDMNSRRHTDNFTPSQKSPIPLNRYDDFDDLVISKSYNSLKSPSYRETRPQEKRIIAKALFNFVGQTPRELTFKKGDIIYIRRQIDKNWYEGEHNAMIGLFPFNYVEIVPFDGQSKVLARKPHEGQARAKFNFIAQTHLELSLAKGENVILTRRVDDNWFEGRIGNKKGIFPVSYVEILMYPGEQQDTLKPVAAPASHSLLLNGSSGGKQSMGSHHYQPSFPTSGSGTASPQTVSFHHAKPASVTPVQGNSLARPQQQSKSSSVNVNQTLHIDTQSEPIPYRAMYKYRPQNEDELELLEGDTVYVLEKCDDGWFVGSSQRTGAFGTFPGNYVERI